MNEFGVKNNYELDGTIKCIKQIKCHPGRKTLLNKHYTNFFVESSH